jgi:hypothetical protein
MTRAFHMTRRLAFLALAASVLMPARSWAAWPLITVHKDPNCGCCGGWVEHLEARGFKTKTIETAALDGVRARLGVPSDLAACHTAQVGGYIVEGHVPASAIARLLTERPRAKGLAVPGMPSGSPGMGGELEEYDVVLFGPNARRVFGRFKGETQI